MADRREKNLPEEKPYRFLSSDVLCEDLSNGMKVLLKEVYPSTMVSVAVWVKVGSVHESDPIAGISHFVEHMLFKGTQKRAVGQIAREIHGCGGYMNAFTDFECTCYWIVLPSRYLSVALDVQVDALLHSLFEEKELRKECQVILEELKMNEDKPEAFCFQNLLSLAFQKHPYGRPIIGFEKTLHGISRRNLLNYFSQHYKANHMFVTVVGDINPEKTLKEIKRIFREIPKGKLTRKEKLSEPPQTEFRETKLSGNIARSHLQMAFHIPHATHDDTYSLGVTAALLGEGRSSRLRRILCEKYSWAEEAEAGTIAYQDAGIFYITTALEQKNRDKVESEIWKEIEKLKNFPVPEEELGKVKTLLESDYFLSQETVEEQGKILGYSQLLGDYRLAEKYLEKTLETTPEDIQRTAKKYLAHENCSAVFYEKKPGF